MSDDHPTQAGFWPGDWTRRRCRACGESKPLAEFSKQRAGRRTYCKTCAGDEQRERMRRMKEDPEKYERHRRMVRRSELATKVGITLAEYEKALESQGSLCAICGRPETAVWRKNLSRLRSLSADHDHATGRFRALLCHKCNRGLGLFLDSPELLEKAAAYLRAYAGQ